MNTTFKIVNILQSLKHITWCLSLIFAPVLSQNFQVNVTGGLTQSFKTRHKPLSPSENSLVTGWFAGAACQFQLNTSLSLALGTNYVVDGGKMKYVNSISPNERISVDESLQWIEVPISLYFKIRKSRFSIGSTLAYRYLLNSKVDLDVFSSTGTFQTTQDFTNRRNTNTLFAGVGVCYWLSEKTMIDIFYKRNLSKLKKGWDPSLLIPDDPFNLNIFAIRARYFIRLKNSNTMETSS